MKQILALLLAMVTILFLTVGCASNEAPPSSSTHNSGESNSDSSTQDSSNYEWPTLTLVGSEANNQGSSAALFIEHFAQLVSERTNGSITLNVNYGGTLASVTEGCEFLGNGLFDFGTVYNAIETELCPVGNMEYLFWFSPDDPRIATKIARTLEDTSAPHIEEAAKNNIQIVAVGAMGDYDLFTTSEVKTLDELSGLKISYVGSQFGIFLESLGSLAISDAVFNRYQNLSTGVYQGSLFTADGTYGLALHEVAPYMLHTDLGCRTSARLAFNSDVWNDLDPEVQSLFREIGLETEEWYANFVYENTELYISKLEEAGVVINALSAEEKDLWCQKIVDSEIIDNWISEKTAAGIDAAVAVSNYLRAAEDAGWTFPWDTSDYIIG